MGALRKFMSRASAAGRSGKRHSLFRAAGIIAAAFFFVQLLAASLQLDPRSLKAPGSDVEVVVYGALEQQTDKPTHAPSPAPTETATNVSDQKPDEHTTLVAPNLPNVDRDEEQNEEQNAPDPVLTRDPLVGTYADPSAGQDSSAVQVRLLLP